MPHLMVASWAESYPQLMDACFGMSKATEFWDQIKADDPRLIDSPVAWEKANQPEEWKKQKGKTIPLWLHGDGIEFSTDSLLHTAPLFIRRLPHHISRHAAEASRLGRKPRQRLEKRHRKQRRRLETRPGKHDSWRLEAKPSY